MTAPFRPGVQSRPPRASPYDNQPKLRPFSLGLNTTKTQLHREKVSFLFLFFLFALLFDSPGQRLTDRYIELIVNTLFRAWRGYLILIECMMFLGLAAGIPTSHRHLPPSILFSCLAHPTTYSPLGMALGCGRILTWSSSICQPSQSRRFSFLGYTKQLSLRLIPGTNTTASATATRLCQEKVSLSFSFLVLFCLIYLGEGETQQIITIISYWSL